MALRRMTAWVTMLLLMAGGWAQPTLACRLACASQGTGGRPIGQAAGQMAAHGAVQDATAMPQHSCCPSRGHGREVVTAQGSGMERQAGSTARSCDGIAESDPVPCSEGPVKLASAAGGSLETRWVAEQTAGFGVQRVPAPDGLEGLPGRGSPIRLDRGRARLLTTRIQV